LAYKMRYQLNPLGNISGGNDFIYADKSIEGIIHLEIPLNVSINNLVIQSNSSFNFDTENKIKGGNMIISVDNLFPFDVAVQFYILDNQNNIVDSLLHDKIKAPHGIMDAQGYVRKPVHSDLVIKLDEDMLRKMRENNEMLISAIIDSDGAGNRHLYQYNNMDVKIILDANYDL